MISYERVDHRTQHWPSWLSLACHPDFVVLCSAGTDTMAYTASALSLLLAGFKKPIVLTGELNRDHLPPQPLHAVTLPLILVVMQSDVHGLDDLQYYNVFTTKRCVHYYS